MCGVQAVINLADNNDVILSYIAQDDFNSPYYKTLFEDGKVIALNLGVDFKAEEFKRGIAEGLKFFSTVKGPYLVHCNEGKDRAGFTSALLAALMGASYDELVKDYMTTYINYYHVEKGSEQYEAVKKSNIDSMLSFIAGVEISELPNVDLEAKTEEFLLAIGMDNSTINTLKSKLSKNY